MFFLEQKSHKTTLAVQRLTQFNAAVHQRTGSCSCFPILPDASWPVMLLFFLLVLECDFMWVQALLLLLGADPHHRIDGMWRGGVHRHACRFWFCNGWAHVEGRRAAIPSPARGVQREACTFSTAPAAPKFQPFLHKHLFRDCLFPCQPLD